FHVFDGATNAPLAGAFVQFDGRAGTTDNAGNVVFTNMPSGTFNYAVSLAGYNPANGQATVAGVPITVNVPLTQGGGVCTVGHSVTFTVIDAKNAQPISGATVTLGSLVATTNAQGVVTFTNVCDGTYTYTVSANGFNTLTGTLTVAGSDLSVRVELGRVSGPPVAEEPDLGIFIGSIRVPEIEQGEGEAPILITFKNDGDAKLEGIRVTAVSTELGLRASIGQFDLSKNEELTRRVILLTEGVSLEPGLYPIRLTVSNDDVTRVVYRDLEVLP
ncbi:MAG: carboxypeptidase regulatory-like domain-containing protein, partial [Nanoarchaeota archaeon]